MSCCGGEGAQLPPLSDEDAALFRAVSSREVLRDKAALLHVDNDVAQYDAYGVTFAVQRIRYFLSHSWKNQAWLKRYGLHYVLYLRLAFCLSFLVAGVLGALEYYGVVPLFLPDYMALMNGRGMSVMRFSKNCIWGLMAFPLVFYFGPYMVPSQTCFLDRCCLDQINIERKEKGIALISEFLRRSDKMVIFWQREYFQRLWCSFEAATFIKFNGIQNVIFVPLALPLFTLSLCLFHFVASVVSLPLIPVIMGPWLTQKEVDALQTPCREMAYLAVKFILLYGPMFAMPAPFLWKFTVMHIEDTRELFNQLDNYSIKNCQCTEEKDREYVEKEVAKAFGTLEDFDNFIRTDMKEHIREVVEEDVLAPYGSVFAGCYAHVHVCVSWANLPFSSYDPKYTPLPVLDKFVLFTMLVCCADAIALWVIAKGAQAYVSSESAFLKSNGWWLGPIFTTLTYTIMIIPVFVQGMTVIHPALRYTVFFLEVAFTAWAYGFAGAVRTFCASAFRGRARQGSSSSYIPLKTANANVSP